MDIFNSVVDVTHIPCVLVCRIWIPILWTKKFHFLYIHNLSYVVLFQEIFSQEFCKSTLFPIQKVVAVVGTNFFSI